MVKEFDIKTAKKIFPQVLFPPEVLNDDNYIVRVELNKNLDIVRMEFGYPEDNWLIK